MEKIDEVLMMVKNLIINNKNGVTALDISNKMAIDRTTASKYLNQLCKENKLVKTNTRPVRFNLVNSIQKEDSLSNISLVDNFSKLIGFNHSLNYIIKKIKESIIYPNGLDLLIIGEIGTGKDTLIHNIYHFAKTNNIILPNAAFEILDCLDFIDDEIKIIENLKLSNEDNLLSKTENGYLIVKNINYLSHNIQDYIINALSQKKNNRIIYTSTKDINLLSKSINTIPIVVNLPSLKYRSLTERYYFIRKYLENESKQLGKQIYISNDAMVALMLYECFGNMTQLKNDIKSSCSNGYLASLDKNYIFISKNNLDLNMNKGLLKFTNYNKKLNSIINSEQDILSFGDLDSNKLFKIKDENFYEKILDKYQYLIGLGLSTEKVDSLFNLDIELFFHRYIEYVERNKEKLYKEISDPVLKLHKKILKYIYEKYSIKLINKYELSLLSHLNLFYNRIVNGQTIYNNALNYIRKTYPEEFNIAVDITTLIDDAFNIVSPVDEIGYLAMFFIDDLYAKKFGTNKKIPIILIAHGDSTATSLAEYINKCTNSNLVFGYNKRYDMEYDEFYEFIKNNLPKNSDNLFICTETTPLISFPELLKAELSLNIEFSTEINSYLVYKLAEKSLENGSLSELKNIYDELK